MKSVIIDTNVIVSSLIQKSYPYLIIFDLFLEGKIRICVSDELIEEYFDVLSRPKFQRFPDFAKKAELILTEITMKSVKYTPEIKLDIISDQDDNMILELAYESKADFIITGNTNDFTISEYLHTKIVTPRQFWELTINNLSLNKGNHHFFD